jgi:hypothetical protein
MSILIVHTSANTVLLLREEGVRRAVYARCRLSNVIHVHTQSSYIPLGEQRPNRISRITNSVQRSTALVGPLHLEDWSGVDAKSAHTTHRPNRASIRSVGKHPYPQTETLKGSHVTRGQKGFRVLTASACMMNIAQP